MILGVLLPPDGQHFGVAGFDFVGVDVAVECPFAALVVGNGRSVGVGVVVAGFGRGLVVEVEGIGLWVVLERWETETAVSYAIVTVDVACRVWGIGAAVVQHSGAFPGQQVSVDGVA